MAGSQGNRGGGGRSGTRGGKAPVGRRYGSDGEESGRSDDVGQTPSSRRRDIIRIEEPSHRSGANVVGQTPISRRRDILRIEEPEATLGRRRSQEYGFESKSKKPVEGKKYYCGRYVVTRGGKSGSTAGSHSRVACGDPLADMAGVLRNTTVLHDIPDDGYDFGEDAFNDIADGDAGNDFGGEEDGPGDEDHGDASNGEDHDEVVNNTNERNFIKRIGKRFACQRIHRSAILILEQHFDGAWAKWKWDPKDDQDIYEGFINVLKDRFRDIMKGFRVEPKRKAREAGHHITDDEENFEITHKFPPDAVPPERWKTLCKYWNTSQWLKRSAAGRNNRSNDLSRHTSGSMGFDEHRIRLDKRNGGPVGFDIVFIDTHATKESKKRLQDGEVNVNDLEKLDFVTDQSKQSFALFTKELERLYGKDRNQNLKDRDDLAVWESVHPNRSG